MYSINNIHNLIFKIKVCLATTLNVGPNDEHPNTQKTEAEGM